MFDIIIVYLLVLFCTKHSIGPGDSQAGILSWYLKLKDK